MKRTTSTISEDAHPAKRPKVLPPEVPTAVDDSAETEEKKIIELYVELTATYGCTDDCDDCDDRDGEVDAKMLTAEDKKLMYDTFSYATDNEFEQLGRDDPFVDHTLLPLMPGKAPMVKVLFDTLAVDTSDNYEVEDAASFEKWFYAIFGWKHRDCTVSSMLDFQDGKGRCMHLRICAFQFKDPPAVFNQKI